MYSPRKEAPVRTASPSPLRRGDQEPQGSGLSFAQVEHFLAIPDRQKHGRSQPHAPNRRTSHGAASGLSRLRGRTPEPDRRTDQPVTGNTPRRLRRETEVDGEASTGGCVHVRGGAYALATPRATAVTCTCSD